MAGMRLNIDTVCRWLIHLCMGLMGATVTASVSPEYVLSGFIWGVWLSYTLHLSVSNEGGELVLSLPWDKNADRREAE